MSLLSKYVILFYNVSQFLGWGFILAAILVPVSKGNYMVLTDPSVVELLRIVQTMQYLDVVFALVGLSQTKVVPSFIQTTAKNGVVWAIFPFAVNSIYPLFTIICWAIGELIRYGNYLNDGLQYGQNWVKHLRYNAFILLYPAGVTGEFMSAGDAKATLEAESKTQNITIGGVELPISNLMFINIFRIIAYPGFAFMYIHTLKLRSRFYQREKKRISEEKKRTVQKQK